MKREMPKISSVGSSLFVIHKIQDMVVPQTMLDSEKSSFFRGITRLERVACHEILFI